LDTEVTSQATTGQVFARMINAYGVSHVFIVPAIFNSAMEAMEDFGIRRIATHHEMAAAFMADGYARASRRPGLCFAQAVGSGNMAAALREAYLAGSPVICVTGGPEPSGRYRFTYQINEDLPMFEPVTKLNAHVDLPGRLPDILRQAFRVATTGGPGPVHLELPGRLGEGVDGMITFDPSEEPRFAAYPAFRPAAESEDVMRAAEALARSKRPMIIAGGGAVASGASEAIVALAERYEIPVAVTLAGKETIVRDHPLSIGLVGNYGLESANRLALEADLVVLIGARGGGLTTGNGRLIAPDASVVQCDIDPVQLGRMRPVVAALLGDAHVVAGQLTAAITPEQPRHAWLEHVRAATDAWLAAAAPVALSDAVPMRPERVCREITESLPTDGIVVADTGHTAIWAGSRIDITSSSQRFMACAGTLGWALPAAIGAKCAFPDRPVLCFTGDGGIGYHLAELETAARAGINIVVVVNNNGAYQQVKPGIDAAYGGTQRGLAGEMWRFGPIDYARVAEEMGCLGIRVEQPEAVGTAVTRAFAAGRPVLIDAVTDVEAFPMPSWA